MLPSLVGLPHPTLAIPPGPGSRVGELPCLALGTSITLIYKAGCQQRLVHKKATRVALELSGNAAQEADPAGSSQSSLAQIVWWVGVAQTGG